MTVLSNFFQTVLAWTVGLVLLLAVTTVLTGGGVDGLDEALVAWLGLGFTLSAYPAGLVAAGKVWPSERAVVPLGLFAGASLLLTVMLFGLLNFAFPADGMTLEELRAAMAEAYERAMAAPPTVESWLPFNTLAFAYTRRVDATVAACLFAWVGLLLGHWTSGHSFPPLARAVEWAMGALLLITAYFAGENGWELIVMRAGGPVSFVGDLVLIVPLALVGALTLVVALDRLSPEADNP
jgi:hypothetical protein